MSDRADSGEMRDDLIGDMPIGQAAEPGLDRALERALDPAEVTEIMRLDAALVALAAGRPADVDPAEDPELAALIAAADSVDATFAATTETRSFHSFHARSRAALLHQLEAERPISIWERLRVPVAAAAGLTALAIGIGTLGGPVMDSVRGGDNAPTASVSVPNLTPLSTQDQLDRLAQAVEGIRERTLSGQTLSSAQLHSFTENAAQVANAIERQPDAVSPEAVRAYIERAQAAREALSTSQLEPGAEGAAAAAQRAAEDGIVVATRYLGEGVTQGSDTPAQEPSETATPTATPTPADAADEDEDDAEDEDTAAEATPTSTPTSTPTATPTATPAP
jgi:hypothetical protein